MKAFQLYKQHLKKKIRNKKQARYKESTEQVLLHPGVPRQGPSPGHANEAAQVCV